MFFQALHDPWFAAGVVCIPLGLLVGALIVWTAPR